MSSQYFCPNTRLSLPLAKFGPASGEPYFLMKHIVAGLQEKEWSDFFLVFFMFWFENFGCLSLDERLLFLAIIKRMTNSHKNSIKFTRPATIFHFSICLINKYNQSKHLRISSSANTHKSNVFRMSPFTNNVCSSSYKKRYKYRG